MALRQISGPLDVARVPLAADIPTPIASATPDETATPTPEVVTTGNLTLEVPVSGEDCQEITWMMSNRFSVPSIDATISPFNSTNPGSVASAHAYRLLRGDIPQFTDTYVSGNVETGQCRDSDNTCQTVKMTLCITALANALTGLYPSTVTIQVGTQSYDQLYVDATGSIPLDLEVIP